jgi:hypothetical protein
VRRAGLKPSATTDSGSVGSVVACDHVGAVGGGARVRGELFCQ